MSAEDADQRKNQDAKPEAAEEDNDRTVMFTPEDLAAAKAAAGGAAAAEPAADDDRTVMFSPEDLAAVQAAAAEAGSDSAPAMDEDNDRTVMFSPEDLAAVQAASQTPEAPDTPEEDDGDRTVMFSPDDVAAAAAASGAAAAATSDDDDGFGMPAAPPPKPAPAPPVAAAEPEEDDDRTRIAPAGATDDDDDRTVITTARPRQRTGAPVSPPTQTPTFTENPGFEPPAAGATPLSSLEPGTVINNMYRVEERLDQGGMGRVFRGVEIGTGEAVAIKVILPEMAEDDKVTQMFRREARTLRQLHHDAIVRYFAYVPPDERMNLHALVMGFIQGTKLSDRLAEKGGLSNRQVVQLTMRLADGLEKAHQIGIVHRDLSPDNVMLPDGDLGKATLIDFGISRSSTVKDGTIGNEFAGKLKYVSPEQLGLYGGDAEGPSDVYSLGLLMIAMMTGKPVPMGNSIADAVQKRQGMPDLANVPLEFRELLGQMLQPDPAERMPSMQAVIDHLSEFDGAITGLGGRRGTRAPVADR
ncbi:MAG: serine/threonine-protein kinase, partial [Pseudomonadota bacterium]